MFTRYYPRPLTFLGMEAVAGHRIKVYAIRHGDKPLARDRFAGGWALAAAALPPPDPVAGRPGVGFAVQHQGATGDYLILCWWDRENELPTRVYVRGVGGWLPAAGGESFCVWDLRVMWWEREAYVSAVLSGRPNGIESYLTAVAEGYA